MTTVICPIVASTVVRGRATATAPRVTPAWERASTGKATTRQCVEPVTESTVVGSSPCPTWAGDRSEERRVGKESNSRSRQQHETTEGRHPRAHYRRQRGTR